MAERNIYIAIMRAAARGDGLRLSPREVADLAFDDAIETHAANCLDETDWQAPDPKRGGFRKPKGWAAINPYKKRKGANLST